MKKLKLLWVPRPWICIWGQRLVSRKEWLTGVNRDSGQACQQKEKMEGVRSSITVGVWICPRKASVKTVTSFVCIAKKSIAWITSDKGQFRKTWLALTPDWKSEVYNTRLDSVDHEGFFCACPGSFLYFCSGVEVYSLSWLRSFVISIGLNLAWISQELLKVFLAESETSVLPRAKRKFWPLGTHGSHVNKRLSMTCLSVHTIILLKCII